MNYEEMKQALIEAAEAAGIKDYEIYSEESSAQSVETYQHEISQFSSETGFGISLRCIVNGKTGAAATEVCSREEAVRLVAAAAANAELIESTDEVYLHEAEDSYESRTKEAQELIDDGILRVNGITPIFSRISFFFMMKPFAEKFHLAPPVTELEVEPLLYRMAEILERAREAIERHLAVPEPLPLYLAVPDMLDFIVDYERGERLGSEKLGRELAETLAAGFRCDVNRISIS